jgi:histidine triad (HIT) family protein
MADCIFCKIVAGQAPAQMLYQDEQVSAFQDIHPVAPVHILIVPNRHIASVSEASISDEPALGRLFTIAGQLAKQAGLDRSGYRLIVNTGPDSGQVVYHLHVHLIGGQRMRFPMG